MKAIITLVLLLAALPQAWAQPTLINEASCRSTTATCTTGDIDTTGANFIGVCSGKYFDNAHTLADSKGNTYTALPKYPGSGNNYTEIWYVKNPTVGTGHNFTLASGSSAILMVMAFSGMTTTGSEQDEDGADSTSASSIAAGSVSVANSIALACSIYYSASAPTVTIDSSFVSPPEVNLDSVLASGQQGAFTYKYVSGSGTESPTFSFGTTTGEASAAIAAFQAAAAAAAPRHRIIVF
jgi:hypothetical protein